ncbi:MAG TPA: cadherin-like domain-containing protein, partial [Thermoguttaceae bacterium]|nr:cadherin-like domain-containing protein [Thermoguttaceae bacterium]
LHMYSRFRCARRNRRHSSASDSRSTTSRHLLLEPLESRELLSVAGLDSGLQSLAYAVDDSPVVIESRISAGSDDAEQTSSGGMRLTSTDLELVYDGSNQDVGMRFNELNIPQGATITNAYVQFKVDEISTKTTSVTFRGEDVDSAATFNTSKYNISSRPTTAASVAWTPVVWDTVGEAGIDQRTPDLASIVQEIVDRPGWINGNSLVLLVSGSGERTAESYNGDSDGAALLHVEYTADGGIPDPTNLPPVAGDDMATVSESGMATLAVLANDADADGDPLSIANVNTDGTKGIVTVNANGTISYDPAGRFDSLNAGQSAIDSFVYTISDGRGGSDTATATVTVIGAGGASTTAVVESRVSSSSDDAEEAASGTMKVTSSDLELVYSGSDQQIGMRFNNLAIPQGATITNAYIQFQVDETKGVDTALTIRGEDTSHAAAFGTSKYNISSRSTTAASVAWAPVPWDTVGEAGADQRTPDLASIIQEIVDRSDWSVGNSMAMIITGTGERVAESYNGDSDGAPLLRVEYTTDGSTPPPVPVNVPPVAGNDKATVAENGQVTVNLLANDRDGDGDAITVTSVDTAGTKGVVTLHSNGTVDYNPDGQFDGLGAGQSAIDAFAYTISDGKGGTDTALVTVTITGVDDAPASATLEVRVATSFDDAEELATGRVRLTSADLEFVYDGSNQTVAMRFNDLSIPQGATITNAYLQFQVDESNSGATSVTFRGEDTDHAAGFVASNFNLSSRSTTAASVAW